MILLGVDFGDVRMGFASCDKDWMLATGLETVNVSGVRDAAKKFGVSKSTVHTARAT